MGVNTKYKILIVDDDETIRQQMKWALTDEYEVFPAENRRTAIDLFRRELPPVVTLDLGLAPHPREATEGLLALSEMLEIDPRVKIIIVSGNADRANALKAIEQGAFDFFTKPIEIDEIRITLRRAIHVFQLEEENRQLKRRPIQEGRMIGTSRMMEGLFATIRKVSTADIPVLIQGESGTGKELVAQSIHQQSARNTGPFIAINCGAIPENLLESELFGHEKGAFTGAHAQRKGRIEYAAGGTLFLDEIGELGLGLQVKLLRFLQEKTIERVGGRESLSIDARVIAATHRDLKERMAGGTFREDLFYRLSVVSISVPPLRERNGDLMLLVRAFISRFTEEIGKKVKGLTPTAIEAVTAYAWPGNVRELENKIRRGVVMSDGVLLTPEDLELTVPTDVAPLPRLKTAREQLERQLVESAMARFGGNVTQAASALGISRQALHDILSKHQIERPS
ncbi:MAG: PEP-CTERM-box response regulator transcription factor [Nitrospirae bacterium]|nr:PEP-CTERM-box response regulator transcription factor [Candidatus Manganitrophaceae bacterium]